MCYGGVLCVSVVYCVLRVVYCGVGRCTVWQGSVIYGRVVYCVAG